MSAWSERGGYLLYLVTLVVLALEVLLRLVVSDPEYYWDHRFLFASPGSFENQAAGIWTYRPNAEIREVAAYAIPSLLPFGMRFAIEYDCRMRSNNLGLLQDDDVAPGVEATVVVGDSFTSGQGGCPWFHRLQALRPSERLVNGGLLGTGIEQWRRLIDSMRERGVNARRLLVIAISNDFKRKVWSWKPEQLACIDDGSCPADFRRGHWEGVALDESHARLIERTAVRYAQRFPNAGALDVIEALLQRHSFVFKFARRAHENLKAMLRGADQRRKSVDPGNEAALAGLEALGIPFRVLMIPQRNELGLWGRNPDTRHAVESLNAAAIDFDWCALEPEDFMANDGHPNRQGYDKVVACADRALRQLDARPGASQAVALPRR